MDVRPVPENFRKIPENGGFGDSLSPFYVSMESGQVRFGLRVEPHHCNGTGRCHGAALMAMMDIALGWAVGHALGKHTPTPTINMSVDYMTPGELGDWLTAEIEGVELTRRLGFAHGFVSGSGGPLTRASACFKLPRDVAAAPGVTPEQFAEFWRRRAPKQRR
jgi:uncharacterized protein (TIGR00369 family)